MIDVMKLANAVARAVNPQYGRSVEALHLRDLAAGALREELKRQFISAHDDVEAAVDAAMVEMANIAPPLRRSECRRLILAARAAGPQSGAWVLADDVRELALCLETALYGARASKNPQLCDVVAAVCGVMAKLRINAEREELWVERAYLGSDGMPVVERLPISAMPAWLQQLYGR